MGQVVQTGIAHKVGIVPFRWSITHLKEMYSKSNFQPKRQFILLGRLSFCTRPRPLYVGLPEPLSFSYFIFTTSGQVL